MRQLLGHGAGEWVWSRVLELVSVAGAWDIHPTHPPPPPKRLFLCFAVLCYVLSVFREIFKVYILVLQILFVVLTNNKSSPFGWIIVGQHLQSFHWRENMTISSNIAIRLYCVTIGSLGSNSKLFKTIPFLNIMVCEYKKYSKSVFYMDSRVLEYFWRLRIDGVWLLTWNIAHMSFPEILPDWMSSSSTLCSARDSRICNSMRLHLEGFYIKQTGKWIYSNLKMACSSYL